MTAVRSVAATVLVLLALPAAAAESPSPSPASPAPEDRTTSVTVSPGSGPDRSSLVLRGYSDCAVIDGHLLFTTYDGKADNVVARTTSKAYDYEREKYPYTVRLTVPASAAPGAAKVYAEPFCGPPEEYPASGVLPFRVLPGRLTVRVTPRRPDGGDLIRVRASTCDGRTGSLTVRVREGDRQVDRRVGVDGTGFASLSVRLAPSGGPVEVSLPRAAAECRGSSYAGPVVLTARAVEAPRESAGPTPTASASSAAGSASPTVAPSAASASPSPAAAAPRTRAAGRGRAVALPIGLLVLAAAAAVGAVALRRRARRG